MNSGLKLAWYNLNHKPTLMDEQATELSKNEILYCRLNGKNSGLKIAKQAKGLAKSKIYDQLKLHS